MRVLSLLLAVLAGCASVYRIGPVDVAPTGGAGFAGVRSAVVNQEPAITVPAGCTGHCPGTVVAESVDLTPNRHYEWVPALSTGVAFRHYAASGVGAGVGLNIVFVPGHAGPTEPWPAVTLHLGTHQAGFFAGFVIAPTDGITMPPGVSVLRVQRDHVPDLVTAHTGRAGNLFFGIELGGAKTP